MVTQHSRAFEREVYAVVIPLAEDGDAAASLAMGIDAAIGVGAVLAEAVLQAIAAGRAGDNAGAGLMTQGVLFAGLAYLVRTRAPNHGHAMGEHGTSVQHTGQSHFLGGPRTLPE